MSKFFLEAPEGSEVKQNTASDLIVITKDKIENILLKHLKNMNTQLGWVTPLGLTVSIALTLMTTNFKDFANISASIWTAVFIIGLVLSIIWLIVSVVRAFIHRGKTTIEYLIKKFQSGQDE
jgi:uncharacterized membrane protein